MNKTRAEHVDGPALDTALLLLTPTNRLVCQVAISTGLRLGDVLALTTAQLRRSNRVTVKEAKTGKSIRKSIPKQLAGQLLAQAGEVWVFPNRLDPQRHRVRQTVWKDLKRAAKALRLEANVTPHSLRKVYAVRSFQQSGDLGRVQQQLNHSDPAVTMLYALADHMAAINAAQGYRRPSRPR